MVWAIANKFDLAKIIDFLLINEWIHIQAISPFCSGYGYEFPTASSNIVLIKKNNGEVNGVIVISNKGLIYPVLEEETRLSTNEKKELIKLLTQINVRIHGVIGLKEDVDFIDQVLFKSIRGSLNYIILKHNKEIPIKDIIKIKVVKANPKDIEKLLPLELEYQKEEVILNISDLNRRAVKENFRNKLKVDDIYYISGKNIPLSKGGTSYKSHNYALIGGVFTWKPERNKGYSTQLLQYMITDLLHRGYISVLFVKKDNKPALHLYEKLNFITPLDYKINYYYN
ncbi:MAG: GNAT family N-acetyltransferase [Spirochaetales bacterium]|nr:GNAT family N-acetyltransferase [Spirochaetales bacterium]